ncbi:MAG: cupin domain-containing protein [Nocardioides sp.]
MRYSYHSAAAAGQTKIEAMTSPDRTNAPANLQRTLDSFEDLWSPRILAQINDYDLRVAKVRGEYLWHRHPDTEELFLVLDGRLDLGLRDANSEEHVHLKRGDVYVVPRNHLHRPASTEGATLILVEPTGTLTTGDYDGEIPDHIDSTTGHSVVRGP